MKFLFVVSKFILINPELFKVNININKEKLFNLCALVSKDDESSMCSSPTSTESLLIVGLLS